PNKEKHRFSIPFFPLCEASIAKPLPGPHKSHLKKYRLLVFLSASVLTSRKRKQYCFPTSIIHIFTGHPDCLKNPFFFILIFSSHNHGQLLHTKVSCAISIYHSHASNIFFFK